MRRKLTLTESQLHSVIYKTARKLISERMSDKKERQKANDIENASLSSGKEEQLADSFDKRATFLFGRTKDNRKFHLIFVGEVTQEVLDQYLPEDTTACEASIHWDKNDAEGSYADLYNFQAVNNSRKALLSPNFMSSAINNYFNIKLSPADIDWSNNL